MRRILSTVARRLFRPSETIEGYEHPELVETVFRKTIAYQPDGEWPELDDASTVLDFGGGCGIHYKQANPQSARWAIVETEAMVERARELSTSKLRFFTSIQEAADWLGPVDVMHSNGAVQYCGDPHAMIDELCSLNANRLLWRRLLFSADATDEMQSSLLSDNGPGVLTVKEKLVRYRRTSISEQAFLEAHREYRLVDHGADWFNFQSLT